jgi:CBS domain-containing protein
VTPRPAERETAQPELLSLVTARVRDTPLRKPVFVEGGLSLVEVCRTLRERNASHALVRDTGPDGRPRLGMFTTTDLRDALLHERPPGELAVREVARFDLLGVTPEADVFEALWLMTQHRVHRLVVRESESPDAPVLGVLAQLDLVSFVARHSHVVALQIDEAQSPAALRAASAQVDEAVASLHASGIRIERIARLVSELNTRLMRRLWTLVAPAELVANSCLLAMGSEGRGEQLIKTDQDNALLLRDGFEWPDLPALAERFSAELVALGWPPCPGGIMVSNPLWRQPLSAFCDTLSGWANFGMQPAADASEGAMRLAIFVDAAVVAGDAALLASARAHLRRVTTDSDAFLARFAAAADQFAEPGNWFTRLTNIGRDEQPLDLKKLGTFPIVHGVRALALAEGSEATGTLARIAALQQAGRLDGALALDLGQALHHLMGVRLTHQLAQRRGGGTASNEVRPSALSTLERETLHDALGIVRRFRAHLRQRFRFDSL